MCNSLLPQGQQHSRLLHLSLSLRVCGVCSNSCPLSQWYHPDILSCPQSFPVSVFSNKSALCFGWPKCWSFSFSISPSNEYSEGWFSFRLTDLISLLYKQLSGVFYSTSSKASILQHSAFVMVHISHIYVITGKPWLWLHWSLLAMWYLCFLMSCLGLSYLFFQGVSIF